MFILFNQNGFYYICTVTAAIVGHYKKNYSFEPLTSILELPVFR